MFAIRAPHAFDGERFVEGGATVLVEGSTIAGVEPSSYAVPADCTVIEHAGATVLPGLVDTHVHLVGDSGPLALERVAAYSDEQLDSVVTDALRSHLVSGVTTVRDLGDRRFNVVERRDLQRARDDGLPWVVASGPPVTSPGGHCFFLGGEVASPEEIRDAVRERAERGVDVVKVMASGGMNTQGTDVTSPQFSFEELRLLVDEAHRAGLPVTAHAHAAVAVDQVVAVGVDGVEHAAYLVAGQRRGLAGLMDSLATDEQLAALAATGVPVCPTLGGFRPDLLRHAPPHLVQDLADAGVTPEQIGESRLDLVGRMHRAGVRLVSGSDAGITPTKAHGLFAHSVLELGKVLPTAEVLATATRGAAEVCGLGGSKGRLRGGCDADVLVVDGDLSADLAALLRVRQVVLRGTDIQRGPAHPLPPRTRST